MPAHEDDEANDEQEGQQRYDQRGKDRRAVSLCPNDDIVVSERVEQCGVFHRWQVGPDALSGRDPLLRFTFSRRCHEGFRAAVPGNWLLEVGLDRRVGQDDLRDVAGVNLLLHHRVRDGDALGVPLRIEDSVELVGDEPKKQNRDHPGWNARTTGAAIRAASLAILPLLVAARNARQLGAALVLLFVVRRQVQPGNVRPRFVRHTIVHSL